MMTDTSETSPPSTCSKKERRRNPLLHVRQEKRRRDRIKQMTDAVKALLQKHGMIVRTKYEMLSACIGIIEKQFELKGIDNSKESASSSATAGSPSTSLGTNISQNGIKTSRNDRTSCGGLTPEPNTSYPKVRSVITRTPSLNSDHHSIANQEVPQASTTEVPSVVPKPAADLHSILSPQLVVPVSLQPLVNVSPISGSIPFTFHPCIRGASTSVSPGGISADVHRAGLLHGFRSSGAEVKNEPAQSPPDAVVPQQDSLNSGGVSHVSCKSADLPPQSPKVTSDQLLQDSFVFLDNYIRQFRQTVNISSIFPADHLAGLLGLGGSPQIMPHPASPQIPSTSHWPTMPNLQMGSNIVQHEHRQHR